MILLEYGDAVRSRRTHTGVRIPKIEEAALTGESVPSKNERSSGQRKGLGIIRQAKEIPLGDRKTWSVWGVMVVYGRVNG